MSGDELRMMRIKSNLTIEQAAADMGIRPQTVRNWEAGRVEPDDLAMTIIGMAYANQDAFIDTVNAAAKRRIEHEMDYGYRMSLRNPETERGYRE